MVETQNRTGTRARSDSRSIAAHVRNAINSSLRRRVTDRGTVARSAESEVKRAASWVWDELRRHPYLGIAIAGVGGVAAASALGVGELAVGIAVAYGAFNVLVRGESPEEAAKALTKQIEEI